MKPIIISLLLLLTTYSQNKWYVDYNVSGGNHTGTSWTNAWKYTGARYTGDTNQDIDWSVIGNGDTIFFNGGADSLVYLPYSTDWPHYWNQNGTLYTYTTQVVVCPSWETGHNGKVILGMTPVWDASTQGMFVAGGYLNNVKWTGFTIRDTRNISSGGGIITLWGDNLAFTNNRVETKGLSTGIGFKGYNILIKDNYLSEIYNENVNATDPIGTDGGYGGVIDGNTIILNNNYTMVTKTNLVDGGGMSATGTSLTDTDLTGADAMTTNYHVNAYVKVSNQYLRVTSNNGNTFYGTGGWNSVASNGFGTTITATSLYYNFLTGNPMPVNLWIGATVTCGGSTLTVTSNTGDTFYGTGGWTGGTPSNGTAYSCVNTSAPAAGSVWWMEGGHRDGIQFGQYYGATPNANYEIVISNNLFVDKGTRGTGWNGLIYTSGMAADVRFLIYNNIFVNKEEISSAGIFLYETEPNNTSIRLFNNTIINKGDGAIAWDENEQAYYYSTGGLLTIDHVDTLFVKNNILLCDTTVNGFVSNCGFTIPYTNYNNNVYAADDYNLYGFACDDRSNKNRTWTQWKAILNSDGTTYRDATNSSLYTVSLNSSPDDVVFADKYGLTAADYLTTTGRDLGNDLSTMPDYAGIVARHPDILYDIRGVARGYNGTWDIGALEYCPPKKFRNAMFLHRSVGGNIYDQGGATTNVPDEVVTYNSTHSYAGENAVNMDEELFPWNNSGNCYWEWRDVFDGTDPNDDIYQFINDTTYDIIIMKTCYTCGIASYWNNGASDTTDNPHDQTYFNDQWHYRHIVNIMGQHPDKFFVIWTPAMYTPNNTPGHNYALGDAFAKWQTDTLAAGIDAVYNNRYGEFPPNVHMYDYFHDIDSLTMLPLSLAISPSDNHPNARGTELIAPLFVNDVFDAAIAYESIYNAVEEEPVDSLPNAFAFTDITNANLSTLYTSNLVTFTNFDSAYARAGGYEYQINSGSWVTGYTKVFPNDSARIRLTSSGSYYPAYVQRTLTVGSRSDTYRVTNKVQSGSGKKIIKGKGTGRVMFDSSGKVIYTQ